MSKQSDYSGSLQEDYAGKDPEGSSSPVSQNDQLKQNLLKTPILIATVIVRLLHKMGNPFRDDFDRMARELIRNFDPTDLETSQEFIEMVIKEAIKILKSNFKGLREEGKDITKLLANARLIVDMIEYVKVKANLSRVSKIITLIEEGKAGDAAKEIDSNINKLDSLLNDNERLKREVLIDIDNRLRKGLFFKGQREALEKSKNQLISGDLTLLTEKKNKLIAEKDKLIAEKDKLNAGMKDELMKEKAKLETEVKVEYVKAYFEAVLYTVFSVIAKIMRRNQADTYRYITGNDLNLEDWYAHLNYYHMSIDDPIRGDLAGVVTAAEIMEKLDEWAIHTFATTRIKRFNVVNFGDVAIMEICDPGVLHTRLSELKLSNGRKVSLYASDEALEQKKLLQDAVRESGLIVDNFVKEVKPFYDALKRGYAITKKTDGAMGKMIAQNFPTMLQGMLNAYLNAFLKAAYNRFGDAKHGTFSKSTRAMFKASIERSLIGYYSWMNAYVSTQIGLVRNSITQPWNNDGDDGDLVKCGTKRLELMVTQAIEYHFRVYGRLFCVPLADTIKRLDGGEDNVNSSLLRLPLSIPDGEPGADRKHRWKLSKDLFSVLKKFKRDEDNDDYIEEASIKSTYAWIYAASEEDRENLISTIEEKGQIAIDGVKYFLLVYNPNADFKRTNYGFVRGVWFILKEFKDGMRFQMLSRTAFEKIFKADYMNVTFAFKQRDGELVNYTYRCVPLPPTQGFSDKNGKYLSFNEPKGRINTEIGSWARNTMLDSKTGSMSDLTAGLVRSVLSLSRRIDNGLKIEIKYPNEETTEAPPNEETTEAPPKPKRGFRKGRFF